jgi:glyoxylate carboligase
MSTGAAEFESLLCRSLAPVEPPDELTRRLERTLVSLTALAQEQLDSWELSAMRDPRNWVRPVAAGVVGVTAGTALVVLRVRARHRTRAQQSGDLFELTRRTLRDARDEARRILPKR